MDGFDGADFIAGSVRGYRWWSLQAPEDLSYGNPARAAESWQPGLLRGMRGSWHAGENTAECKAGAVSWLSSHLPSEVPHDRCSCGFWAYWEIQYHDMSSSTELPVVGVVEGYGQLLTGPRGFRAGKAKIVALHLPLLIEPDLPCQEEPPVQLDLRQPREYGSHNRWYNHPKFHGRVISMGIEAPRSLQPYQPPPQPQPTAAEIAEAEDRAEAWTAVISDRLQVMYPDAEVCETMALLLAKYPPSPQYTHNQSGTSR